LQKDFQSRYSQVLSESTFMQSLRPCWRGKTKT